MLYRLILVSIAALVIIGASAVFYEYYIDLGDSEAKVMVHIVSDCLAPRGVLDINKLKENNESLLEFCGFDKAEIKNFYVRVSVRNPANQEILLAEQGDSGITWIRQAYSNIPAAERTAKYKQGYFAGTYCVNYYIEDDVNHATILVEAFKSYGE
jgi:hypothetical protein